jgi:hypothetical protein
MNKALDVKKALNYFLDSTHRLSIKRWGLKTLKDLPCPLLCP